MLGGIVGSGCPTSNIEESGLDKVLGPFLQGREMVGELVGLGGGEETREQVLTVCS